MTFFVDNRYVRVVYLADLDGKDISLSANPGTVYWVFEFANGEKDKIEGVRDEAANTVSFDIPDGFFADDRVGRLTHKVLLVDDSDDGTPAIGSDRINDVLVRNGVTPKEIDDI